MRQLKISPNITNRDESSLEKYLQEVAKKEMVTSEEEIELAKRIKQWDKKALDALVEANLRFVVSVAKQYQNQWLSLNELINEGNIWLIKAAQKFDETRGFKFISYAVRWIRQSILHALNEKGRLIKLPLNKTSLLYKIHKAKSALEQTLNRTPNEEELAEMLEMHVSEIYTILHSEGTCISLGSSVSNDENTTLEDKLENHDFPTTDDWLINESCSYEIKNALHTLDYREAQILELYYGLNWKKALTLEEISEEFDLTRERVRQIKEKAIRRLRHTGRSKNLKQYLGK